MAYKVLVVDDSTFFRRRVKQILEQDSSLVVVGDAKNGMEAISQVQLLKPDVVTMDIEMPIMDGISAVKRIMAAHPVPIIMFSSLTHAGAKATLDALDAGALDFLPKKFDEIASNHSDAATLLQDRVKALCRKRPRSNVNRIKTPRDTSGMMRAGSAALVEKKTSNAPQPRVGNKQYRCLAIGTSTGGPVALQKILAELPVSFPLPIVLVQHMPGTFTKAFAERLNSTCEISVKEAEHGEKLINGCAYLAPGGRQMTIEGGANSGKIKISDASDFPDETYKPSVDLTFSSLAKCFGGDVLGVILTGMGSDGRDGCRALKSMGAKIWAQDEKSSVVYGMPQAVTAANLSEQSIALADIAKSIKQEMSG
jgi:two-component system chemotaxis response regulator CheB